jgi:hypothetical protein
MTAGGSEVALKCKAFVKGPGEDTTAGGSDMALEFDVFIEGLDGVAGAEDGLAAHVDVGVAETGAMPAVDSSNPVGGCGSISSAGADGASCRVIVEAMVVVVVE